MHLESIVNPKVARFHVEQQFAILLILLDTYVVCVCANVACHLYECEVERNGQDLMDGYLNAGDKKNRAN